MRALLIILLALLPLTASAYFPNPNGSKSGKVDASSNNIPVAFSTAAGSLIISSTGGKLRSHLFCENETTTRIAVILAEGTTAPSSTSTALFYVPANSFRAFDDVTVLDRVYIQSDGSAISTGTAECEVW